MGFLKSAAKPSELVKILQEKDLALGTLDKLLPKKPAALETLFQGVVDEYCEGPLHIALRHAQSLAVIDRLIQLLGDKEVIKPNSNGDLPAHIAAVNLDEANGPRNTAVLRRLMDADDRAISRDNGRGYKPWHDALNALLQKVSADPSAPMQVYIQVIDWMMETYRPSLTVKDPQGDSVWHYLVRIAAIAPDITVVTSFLKKLVASPWVSKDPHAIQPWREHNGRKQTPWAVFLQLRHTAHDFEHRRESLGEILTSWEQEPDTTMNTPRIIVNETSSYASSAATPINGDRRPPQTLSSKTHSSPGSKLQSSAGSKLQSSPANSTPSPMRSGSHWPPVPDLGPVESQQQLYEPMPPREIYGRDSGSVTSHSTFSSITDLGTMGETRSISKQLDAKILRALPGRLRPFDVFLVHTGAQKAETVSNLQTYFRQSGFSCFLDRDMTQSQGGPADQMRWALETCRYAIVLISRDFLLKKHPCDELNYAFQRAEWLRGHYDWRSLYVICYDITIGDYTEARKDANRSPALGILPPLERKHVLREYTPKNRQGFPEFVTDLAEEMRKHDVDTAGADWVAFLRSWSAMCASGFPRADNLYLDQETDYS